MCTYGAVALGGNKIDASGDEPEQLSFKIKKPNSYSLVTKFYDYFANAHGTVKISLISGKLIWQLITPPDGEYYVPDTAILIRMKPH